MIRKSVRFGALAAAALLAARVTAFTTQTLVLQNGLVPTLNGSPVGATPYTGTVDTYIDSNYPDTNYIDAPTLSYGNMVWLNPGFTNIDRAYIRFDDWTGYLPAEAFITGAKVTLVGTGTNGTPHQIRYRTAAIDLSTVTYNNAGSYTANQQHMGLENSGVFGTARSIDVTNLSRSWLSGSLGNYGLMLTGYENYSASYARDIVYSSDDAVPANRPQYVIQYVIPEQVGMIQESVRVLNGPTVIQDTFIKPDTTTRAASLVTDNIQDQNPVLNRCRALLKVLVSADSIADLKQSSDPFAMGTTRLVQAKLSFSIVDGDPRESLTLYTAAQNWDDTAATGAGGVSGNGFATASTEWAQSWETAMSNYSVNLGGFAYDPEFPAGEAVWDITSVLQAWIDNPSTNFGFILDGDVNYGARYALTGYAASHMQPTLTLFVEEYLIPEPSSVLLAAAGASMALRRRRASRS